MPSEIIAALRQQFRKKFRSIDNCRNLDENVLKPWLYCEDDISIGKVYCSQKGWFVAEMKRAEYRSDGPIEGGGPFDAQWYVVEPTGAIRFLDSGMRLVGAGDYDRDRKSELLFSINRYGIGGYELLFTMNSGSTPHFNSFITESESHAAQISLRIGRIDSTQPTRSTTFLAIMG